MSLLRHILNLLFPSSCSYCHEPVGDSRVPNFCLTCWHDFYPISGPVCGRCGKPFDSPETLSHTPFFHSALPAERRRLSLTRRCQADILRALFGRPSTSLNIVLAGPWEPRWEHGWRIAYGYCWTSTWSCRFLFTQNVCDSGGLIRHFFLPIA
jgi:Double zinc ribbon domain